MKGLYFFFFFFFFYNIANKIYFLLKYYNIKVNNYNNKILKINNKS